VVGEAFSQSEALEVTRQTHPELVLLNPGAPGVRVADGVRSLKQTAPGVAVVVISAYDTATLKAGALAGGASGYLLKTISCEGLLDALRRIMRGERLLTTRDVGRSLRCLNRQAFGSSDLAKPLTKRELEVLQLLATGLPNVEIAAVLFVATSTIKTHVEHIIGKLGVASRVEAVSWAVQQGLIKPKMARLSITPAPGAAVARNRPFRGWNAGCS
jgi:DNA-binding NarL/FixJ family response regulator